MAQSQRVKDRWEVVDEAMAFASAVPQGGRLSELRFSCMECFDLMLPHHRKVHKIRKSAKTGCHTCIFIMYMLSILENDCSDEKKVFLSNPHSLIYDELPEDGYNKDCFSIEYDGKHMEIFTHQNDATPWPAITPATDISGDTSSQESFARAQSWLQQCNTSHTRCRTNLEGPAPTRVLDIGASPTDQVKLYEPQIESLQYACLSHCWGASRPLTTTLSNRNSFITNGIPWDSIPRTFQDAIDFLHRLSIRYLWIDSLCIIQDSVEDWERESSNMASIYKNAYITIAASQSTSSSTGCYTVAPECFRSTPKIVIGSDGDPYKVYYRTPVHFNDSDNFPLLRRAWVYQERLLSPRFLHFGSAELIWECNELTTVEHLVYRWRQMVEEYTMLNMTFDKDIFPALSGVAKEMARALDTTHYAAGLWNTDLVGYLLWKAIDGQSVRRPSQWRAPTWSWASVLTNVLYHEINPFQGTYGGQLRRSIKATYTELLEVQIAGKSADPTGQIAGGAVVLRGPLAKGVLDYNPNRYGFRHQDYSFRLVHLDKQCPFYSDYCLSEIGEGEVKVGEEIYLLWITELWDRYMGNIIVCLVLRKVQNDGTRVVGVDDANLFERIGLLTRQRFLGLEWFDGVEKNTVIIR